MNSEFSQNNLVLTHILESPITQEQAETLYGVRRLAAVIERLRKRGWKIKTEMKEGKNKYGRPIRYANYKLDMPKTHKNFFL